MFYAGLFTTVLIPALMLLFGWLLAAPGNTVGKPNHLFGYRTKASMRSQETWEFANTYYGKLCMRWSMPMLVLSEGIMFLFQRYAWTLGILFAVQIVLFLSPILVVESAIDKRFDRQGNRREQ